MYLKHLLIVMLFSAQIIVPLQGAATYIGSDHITQHLTTYKKNKAKKARPRGTVQVNSLVRLYTEAPKAGPKMIMAHFIQCKEEQDKELTSTPQGFFVLNHLEALIPALYDWCPPAKIHNVRKALYDIANEPRFKTPEYRQFQETNRKSQLPRMAERVFKGATKPDRTVSDTFITRVAQPTQDAFIVENYLDGSIRFQITKENKKRLVEYSTEQLELMICLYYSKHPQIRKDIKKPIVLTSEQALAFNNLTFKTKKILFKHYAFTCAPEHRLFDTDKEFLPAVTLLSKPYKERPTIDEEEQEAKTEIARFLEPTAGRLLGGKPIKYLNDEQMYKLQQCSLYQLALIKELYEQRGEPYEIESNEALEFVSLPKEIQDNLLKNYPQVTISLPAWAMGMVQKHPRRTTALGLAAGAVGWCVYKAVSK